jgi:hypothetical protein
LTFHPAIRSALVLGALASISFVIGCGDDDVAPADAGPMRPVIDGSFVCLAEDSLACIGDTFSTCEADGEFLRPKHRDCRAEGMVCDEPEGCVTCRAGTARCTGNMPEVCADNQSGWEPRDECEMEDGFACEDGRCVNLCERALSQRSYQGCEFFGVDLDNAAIAIGRDASAQQYAVVVSNPGSVETEVWVEQNDAPFGSEPVVTEIMRLRIGPGDLEVLELPRREVDGSSSNQECTPDDRICPGSEVCVCSRMDAEPPCFCRVSATASGLNDGTHSAVTSQAYRIRSSLPIIAYQFNPLDNVSVFSNDASLLLPTSAIDTDYTVIAWPQTIAHDDIDPERDFDSSRDDEDLRATLTIVGTASPTMVRVELGRFAGRIVSGVGPIPAGLESFESFDLALGPFDVINLETSGLNADFTGTVVTANQPVAVFVGSEASDAPRFETYSTRQCCADHLEGQLFPNQTLGMRFIIGRMPPRSVALNNAFLDPTRDSVAEPNEPEWVRVVATVPGTTTLTTTLPPPDDRVTLSEREAIIFRADQDFILQADNPVAVLQMLSSQEAVGIPPSYPGGDPALIVVPPTEQYRRDYVFLTPSLYAFDFVTIAADRDTNILLDGMPLDPVRCTTSPADGIMRLPGDPPPREVIYRCQLSYPDVIGLPNVRVEEGIQDDGVHTVLATEPVGIVVFGFDAYVSYAYAAGLNLETIN